MADISFSFVDRRDFLLIGISLAYNLAYSRNRFKPLWEALVCMPLFLSPSLLGFYLLIAFSPNSALGASLLRYFDVRLAFSFTGLLIGSIIFSLSFLVQPIQAVYKPCQSY